MAIRFYTERGETPADIEFGEELPVIPPVDGMVNTGWVNYFGAPVTSSANPGYNPTYIAVWEEPPTTVDYTITYETEHGTAPTSKTVTVNDGEGYALTAGDLPTLSADGYAFNGWTANGTAVSVGDTISADTTLTAVWELLPVIVESKGNGYSLFNGVKLPSLPEYDKETYPYVFVGKSSSSSTVRFAVVASTMPWNVSAKSKPIASANGTRILSARNAEGFTVWGDFSSPVDTTEGTELSATIGLPIWANYDIINTTDGTTYLSASDPISLDGMNVIEWNGGTAGLEGFNGETTFYHVSNATDVDVSHPYHLVRKFESDGHLAITTSGFATEDGWYGMGLFGRYINTASETYPTVGVYLRKPAQTTILFAYFPIVPTVDYTITYSSEHGDVPASKTVTVNEGESYVLTAEDLPTLEAEGYTFKGWLFADGTAVSVGDTISANTTLTAVWEEVPTEPKRIDLYQCKNGSWVKQDLYKKNGDKWVKQRITEAYQKNADGWEKIEKKPIS